MAPRAKSPKTDDPLSLFHPVTAEWFRAVFDAPTRPQQLGWPAIARGDNSLILAPTGTGKTLAAFLWCLDRVMLQAPPAKPGTRIVYISPLKALAVDVERNLRSPLAGMVNTACKHNIAIHEPEISVRTGDTPQRERARFRRKPAEILITTPESLYLLLTSDASEGLREVETVIVDEIHALVPTKRGAHLALTLERLQALTGRALQRIGLSATQRPLEEVARFLGGAEPSQAVAETGSEDPLAEPADAGIRWRPVTIVDASAPKRLSLRIEVPVEDMARLSEPEMLPSGDASQGPKRTSIWTAIHPRLLEILRAHHSTILFVNNRRLAERLAGALNELAGEPIARAHHGSLAAPQRSEIEEQLKHGHLRALVATSSLELGIDMGAVDLVVQIEAPPSVASGMQRIGRAGHNVGAVSEGILFPKYRADLIACAAATRAMHEGIVESTRFLRNPLDVLAQQMVAMIAQPPGYQRPKRRVIEGEEEPVPETNAEALYQWVRCAAPFAGLSRSSFDGVLDLLAGRYPSDEFAELRPRINWDRVGNTVTPRHSAKRLAIVNGGTIPDRGLYGVYLAGVEGKAVRVGELDEEMVHESHAGDTFVLGASTWRIEEISHDRVLVSPAPGEPGKMPFWRGDSPGRPLEFGRRIGELVRTLRELPRAAALSRLVSEHDLAPGAAENLLRFLADQEAATTMVPDDRNIVVESCRDEMGDWRVCVLTPFGSRIHAPWAMAVMARIRSAGGPDVEALWADDGFVLRFPETDQMPQTDQLLPTAVEAGELVLRQLGSTALFAAKFREASARALLLPRKRADGRAPLWQQRKKAYDLLSVASKYPAFPILLEAYRECLRDVFDLPALTEILRAIETRRIRIHAVETRTPSPFAASLLFSYVANYLYDGDAPLAERRAQALTIDQDQLRELLGEADLRELLDPDALDEVERQLQALEEGYKAATLDAVHDLLLRIGDLSREELAERVADAALLVKLDRLLRVRRVVELKIGGAKRLVAAEDAARYRDALGVPLPPGLASALLAPVEQPVLELVRRYARTLGPFTEHEAAIRFGLDARQVEAVLHRLVQDGRVLEGAFRPGGTHREWCDAEVLRRVRAKSLARLRKEVEPAEQRMLARLALHWQGVLHPRKGLDALLDVVENLQGAPIPASLLENAILPARIQGYTPADLDTLIAAGEVVWCGVDPLGVQDGRVALYLADKLPALLPQRVNSEPASEREEALEELLGDRGAMFFADLHEAVGGGYPGETLDAIWRMVWRGRLTNDALHPLRAYIARPRDQRSRSRSQHHAGRVFRSRRTTPPTGQGRWSLLDARRPNNTEWAHATALQMLNRYGVLLREHAAAEDLSGGFSAIYGVLKAMEESARIRRGYFVSGLGATQFALPAALDLMRTLRQSSQEKAEMAILSAVDPANPYGAALRWPQVTEPLGEETGARVLSRTVNAQVILRNGELVAYLRRGNPNLTVLLPEEEPERSAVARDLAHFLAEQGQRWMHQEETARRGGLLIANINGAPVQNHFLLRALLDAGFQAAPTGLTLRRILLPEGAPLSAEVQ